MATSLYQKYRPQQFADVIGQQHVVTTLQNEVEANNVSHAYLFSGPRGVGKTSIARLLAVAVNESAGASKEQLDIIVSGKSLDVIEIDAASHTGVDNVRENIIENARVAPTHLPWKVFIIDEVHMLSTSAFNALLKTLEEPPKNTVFILATTEIHKVPETIISRCERFNFRKMTFEQLVQSMEKIVQAENVRVDAEVLAAIAKRSDGALRDAQSLLGQVLSLGGEHITADQAEMVLPHSATKEIIALWQEIVRGQLQQSIARVNKLVLEGVALPEFTKDMLDVLRRIMLYRVQESLEPLEYLHLTTDEMQQMTSLAQQLSVGRAAEMVEKCMDAIERNRTAVIPQVPLELMIIELIPEGGQSQQAAAVTPAPAPQPTTPAPAENTTENAAQVEKTQSEEAAEFQEESGNGKEVSVSVAGQSEEYEYVSIDENAFEEEETEVAEAEPQQVEEISPVEKEPAEEKQEEAIVEQPAEENDTTAEPEATKETVQEQAEETTGAEEPVADATQEESTEEVVEIAVEENIDDGTLSMESVNAKWDAVLQAMKSENHALHLTLKVGKLISVKGSILTFGFEYQFYQDRINDLENKTSIEKVLEEVLGQKVKIESVVGAEYGQEIKKNDSDGTNNIEQPSEQEIANIWDLASASF